MCSFIPVRIYSCMLFVAISHIFDIFDLCVRQHLANSPCSSYMALLRKAGLLLFFEPAEVFGADVKSTNIKPFGACGPCWAVLLVIAPC